MLIARVPGWLIKAASWLECPQNGHFSGHRDDQGVNALMLSDVVVPHNAR